MLLPTIAATPKVTIQRPHKLQPNYTPIKFSDYTFWTVLFSSIALLVWGLLLRVKVENLNNCKSLLVPGIISTVMTKRNPTSAGFPFFNKPDRRFILLRKIAAIKNFHK